MTEHPISVQEALGALRNYRENPARAGRDARLALRADFGGFVVALLDEAVFTDDHPGYCFAVTQLLRNDSLVPALADPSVTSFAQALRLTRSLLGLNQNFINTLLTELLTRKDMADCDRILRALDLVGEFIPYVANWRSLARIPDEGDPRIRAKRAALITYCRFSNEAGLERFRFYEPRMRANIVETLWHTGRKKGSAVLEVAVQDEDNRVAGNACLALYNAGDTRSLARLAEMIDSPDLKRRITAAWAIGKCRDSRFAGQLLEGLRGENPALRRRSVSSIAKLEPVRPRTSEPAAPNPEENALYFVSAPDVPQSKEHELWLRVESPAGEHMENIRPVDFFVWAGERFLLNYSVDEASGAGDVALRIVYPAAWSSLEQALNAGLADKPAAQGWAVSAYGTAAGKPDAATTVQFETDAAALAALLGSGAALSPDATGAAKLATEPESAAPEQHLLLILDGSECNPEPVRALCEDKRIRFHCWRPAPEADAASFPALSRTEEEAALMLPHFLAALGSRYVLRAEQAPTGLALRNAQTSPCRFSARLDLLKGGSDA